MFGSIFNQKKRPDEQNDPVQAQQGQADQNQQYQNQQSQAYAQQPQEQQPGTQQEQAQQPIAGQQQNTQAANAQQSGQPQQPGKQAGQAQGNAPAGSSAKTPVRLDMSALSHLDPRATQVLTHGQEEARRIHQQFIEPEQILLGLLYDEEIYKLLEEFQVDGGKLSKDIQAKEKMGTYKGQPTLSKTSQQVFEQAYKDAKMRGSNFVSPEDLFLVLFTPNYSTASYLQEQGLKKETVVEKITKNPSSNYSKKTILEKYGIDLTEEARQGKLDPVAGRDKEIDRIIHILLRRTKNNPIIIGDTGVGKTAIVEGLAQKIVSGQVPKDLQEKRIFQLDVSSIVAGASHRGEFEERLRGVINEVLGSSNRIILFIDEIHVLMGTGEGEGVNAANIIKPHLARGHLQLIGATTTTEYRKNFEKDKAFERRFQPILADEPSEENAVEMLKVLRPKYEKFHRVTIPDDALKQCVKLSKKYIGERFLPDKAVDLLDEACSEVKLQLDAGKRGDNQVRKGEIETVVSAWTGIPVTKLTEDESEKLLKLEDRIHKRLIDQEEAVVAVSEAVRRGRVGLASGTRPVASFVFLGPTGVGKTELAKTLAELLFGRDDAMARLDMSEFMQKHEVAKLIGAPPGYVGYEEGGVLTEAVRKKPYSIVLLDEIEKAHPDVFNILLQLLEDGRLTDNKGNVISFKNTIVICTSNIGSSLIQQQLAMQDPKAKKTPEEYMKVFKQLSDIVKEELIKFLRPELLNRFDEIVIFKPLQPQHMAGIARLGIAKTAALLKEQGFSLQITEKAIAKLAKDGYDPVYGARPLRRLIQTAIENPIALAIISKKFVAGDIIVIDYNDNTNEFVFTKGGQAQAVSPLNDEQFKIILQKIANPETIVNESDKTLFTGLHDKVIKASTAGNKTASAILSVNAATSDAEIQTIRQELEDLKAQGEEWAKEILDIAETIAQQVQAANNLKKVLLLIVNPAAISSPAKKEKFTQLHDSLVRESQQGNPLAASILAITEATPPETIDKILEDLKKAKEQDNEWAADILSAVNGEIAEEAEKAHEAEPVTKFKKVLQQIINPLYAAAPENKETFTKLYDKISDANQQNHPLATSVLAITDLSSDSDIQQLMDQLQQAKEEGDSLAGEIVDTIETAIKYEGVHELKNTLLLIINPLAAPTPLKRKDFNMLHDKISQESQQGNQLAADILSISETTTDDEILKLKETLEQEAAKNNEVAKLVLEAVSNSDGIQVASSATRQQSPAPSGAGQEGDQTQQLQQQFQNNPPIQNPMMGQQQPQRPVQQAPFPPQGYQQQNPNMPQQGFMPPPVQQQQGSPFLNQPFMGGMQIGNQPAPYLNVNSVQPMQQPPMYQQNTGAAGGPTMPPPLPNQQFGGGMTALNEHIAEDNVSPKTNFEPEQKP